MCLLVGKNLGNILDFSNLTEENIYVLDSPILSNNQFEKFLNYFGNNYKILDCTFKDDEKIEKAIEELKQEAEIAVRQGITQLILSDKNISNKRYGIPMLLCIGAINTHLTMLGLRGYVSINIQSGENNFSWEGRDDKGFSVSTGIYFISIKSDLGNQNHKILLVK